jgi:hypothetical protein
MISDRKMFGFNDRKKIEQVLWIIDISFLKFWLSSF